MTFSLSIPASILTSQAAVPLPDIWGSETVVAWLSARAAGDYDKCFKMLEDAGWRITGK